MPADTRLFFPEIRLQRSENSDTASILYSANLSSRYGRGARLGIYISPHRIPVPYPKVAFLMAYEGNETIPGPEYIQKLEDFGSGADSLFVRMRRYTNHATAVRFDADSSDPFPTIYFPSQIAKQHREIWAHIVFGQ